MDPKLGMSRLLGYQDFYFEITRQTTKQKFAKEIGRDLLLKFICHFLAQFRNNAIPPTEHLIREFFTFNEHQYYENPNYDRVIRRYRYLEETQPRSNFKLISIASLLSMYIWLTNASKIPEQIESDGEQVLPMFKFFLLFNNDELQKYKPSYKTDLGISPDRRLRRLILGMSFPQSDLINADYAQILRTQIYKGAILLNYMSGNPKYLPALTKLLEDFHCNTKEEFFRALAAAVVLGIQSQNNGWTVLQVPHDKNYTQSCFILDKLSVQEEPIADLQDDFLEIRSKPLRKLGEGEYMVVYDLFLLKKIYNGLVFQLSAFCKNDATLINGPFFGHLRFDFSEGVLVYDTFDYIHPVPGIIKITGEAFKAGGLITTEPDYYVRDGFDLLLIESKDFYVKGTVKMSYQFELIENELKTGRLGKAVSQLVTNIKRALLKQLILDTNYNGADISIFPVIVVHDALYSAPALNFWVNYWFEDLLLALKGDPQLAGLNFSKIMPVTIVEIDTLLFFEENFKRGELSLIDLIRRFHQAVSYRKTAFSNEAELINHAYQSVVTFAEFVRAFAHAKNLPLHEDGKINDILHAMGVPL
jgi:hypothetical protein